MTLSLPLLLAGAALATPPADGQSADGQRADGQRADGQRGSEDEVQTGLSQPGIESAIINGEDASEDDYPMAGGMMMDAFIDLGRFGSGDVRLFVCSSTLIAPDVVLLAAHCIDENSFTYGFGSLEDVDIRWTREADLSDHDGSRIADWPADAVTAWDWVYHPDWDLFQMNVGIDENYDVALLFLDTPVLDVPYAYLPTADEAALLDVGMEVAVVGWGQQIATGQNEQPPEGSYAYKQQGMSSIAEVGPAEFKVGEAETDVRKCHGDSGGPSFAWFPNEAYTEDMRLIGVTSHAYDQTDCNETGGVDTRVDFYLEWIDAELRARCADGTRSWCEVEGIIPPPEPIIEEPIDEEEVGDEKGRLLSCASAPGDGPAPGGDAPWGLALLAFGLVGLRRRR